MYSLYNGGTELNFATRLNGVGRFGSTFRIGDISVVLLGKGLPRFCKLIHVVQFKDALVERNGELE